MKAVLKIITKIIKIIAIIIMILLVALILFLISVPIVNDHSAAKVAKRLEKIPLPEQTEYLESVSAAGKLVGNGDGRG